MKQTTEAMFMDWKDQEFRLTTYNAALDCSLKRSEVNYKFYGFTSQHPLGRNR